MILVDGMLLARRCHAKMDFLTNSQGVKTGMEYGFMRSLKSIAKKLGDEDITICWDSKQSIRKAIDPTYKANRIKSLDDSFWTRLNTMKRMLASVYPSVYADGYEADDVMASVAHEAKGKIFIYSNDKDLLQAVRGDTVVLITSRESQLWLWDEEEVINEFGCSREMYVSYKAFLGDDGDNIKGVGKVRKTVVKEKLRTGDPGQLFNPEGYTDGEWDRVMCFGVKRYIDNCELVRLRIVMYDSIEPVTKDEFAVWMNQLEVRSISYGEEF